MLLQPVVKNRHAYASKRSRIQDFILKGAVGAYWGCCRGCGAHLIWVTSIDAFCLKKSLIAPGNLNYFTVLHIWNGFGPGFPLLEPRERLELVVQHQIHPLLIAHTHESHASQLNAGEEPGRKASFAKAAVFPEQRPRINPASGRKAKGGVHLSFRALETVLQCACP